MELQYHSNTRDPISWASLRIPSQGQNEATQGYQEWQGQRISGYSDRMEDPTLRRTTAGLAGCNSLFSQSEEPGSSRFKHVIIPKPNRAYSQYAEQDSLHRGNIYWTHAQRSHSRQDENGYIPSPSFGNQGSDKLHGVSYKNELLLNHSYKNSRKSMDYEPSPPTKKFKGLADSAGRHEENVSAFKVFKRNDNNHQFCRIKDRNKNLPPPPPLVKASEKMNKISKPEMKSRGDVIVIRDSPPLQLPPQALPEHCQSESRKDPLRASKIENFSRDTLHHSRPISSARVHNMEHHTPICVGKNHNPRDGRESMELVQRCQCHHDHMSYLSKELPQFSNVNDRMCGAKAMPFITTHNATRSHYQPHTGIQCHGHPDYHNGVAYSPTKKTSGSHKNKRPRSHKAVDSPSPSRNAPARNFCDNHEALHAWTVLKSQLTELPPESRANNTFLADALRSNTKSVPANLLDSRSNNKRDVAAFREVDDVAAFRDPRQFKDHYLKTRNVVRSQPNRVEIAPAMQSKSEYPYQQQHEELALLMCKKMSQLSKADQARLNKYLEMYGHANFRHHQFIVTQKPSRVPEMYVSHDIQKIPVSLGHDVQPPPVTQKPKYEQKQKTLQSLLMSGSSHEKSTSAFSNIEGDKVVMPSSYADSAFMSHRKGQVSSHLPVHSSLAKRHSVPSSGNMVSRGKPAVMSQATLSSNIPNGDRLPVSSDGKATQGNNIFKMPSTSNASRSPPSLNIPNGDRLPVSSDGKATPGNNNLKMPSTTNASRSPPSLKAHKKPFNETEKQKAISSQSVSHMNTSNGVQEAPSVQKNPVALFQSPPQSRRLSYPLESNHVKENRSQENSSVTLQRSKSEGDQKTNCETDVSSLLENFKEDEDTTVQPCGGYAFDHDSLPIIVAVHSIVVKNDSSKEIQTSDEENPTEEIPDAKKESVITSSHSVVEPTSSTSKNTSTRYQRPILPKPDTMSAKTKLSSEEVPFSGVQSAKDQVVPSSPSTSTSSSSSIPSSLSTSLSTSSLLISLLSSVSPPSSSSLPPALTSSLSSLPPALTTSSSSSSSSSSLSLPPPPPLSSLSSSSSATTKEMEQPVNSVCKKSSILTHYNADNQVISHITNSAGTDNPLSNDLISREKAVQAIKPNYTTNTTSLADSTASVSSEINKNGSSHFPCKLDEEVESKSKSMPRRHSVEELSNKIVETRERIDKEEIDWKKKLLRRLEYVLIKKLKKAERETGEKASIDLTPADKNVKSKEEQKKTKNCKRTKSCSDDTSSKVEHEEKDTKEKCEDATQKGSDKTNEANNASKQKKRTEHHSKSDMPQVASNVDKEPTPTKASTKESVDPLTMNQEEINAEASLDSFTNQDEMLSSSVNDMPTIEDCSESLFSSLSPAEEDDGFGGFSCSDLVIAE